MLHRFQNLIATIVYTNAQNLFITSLMPLSSNDWDRTLVGTGRPYGATTRRNELKTHIRAELERIQLPFCIYCGFHEDIVGHLQRDHIAPKGIYPEFLFEAKNLVLACGNCNGFLKKKNFDTISSVSSVYNRCRFKIVHPYRDRYQDHLKFAFVGGDIVIKHKPYSRKGKATVEMTGINEPIPAQLRGAALMRRHIQLTPALDTLLALAMQNDYSL